MNDKIHDLATIDLGRGKVMILGGCNNLGEPNKKVEIKDLTMENIKIQLKQGGKVYYPPYIDSQNRIHIFTGYGDEVPKHEVLDISMLLQNDLPGQSILSKQGSFKDEKLNE
jgi:hypothetical protein